MNGTGYHGCFKLVCDPEKGRRVDEMDMLEAQRKQMEIMTGILRKTEHFDIELCTTGKIVNKKNVFKL